MKHVLKIAAALFPLLLFSCEEKYNDTKDAGEEFLSNNKSRGSVTLQYTDENGELIRVEAPVKEVISSGVQYAFFYENQYGEFPRTDIISNVSISYKGYFINGDLFEEKEMSSFAYSSLISGMKEVISRMRIGSKARVWIPYGSAYGKDGNETIDPYTALIFDIELLAAF